MILLDTNIVIAFFNGNKSVLRDRLIDIVQIVPFDIECAKAFGSIKSKLRALGKPTGEVDALIAATAIVHKAILVTANKKHFENIESLKIETWQI